MGVIEAVFTGGGRLDINFNKTPVLPPPLVWECNMAAAQELKYHTQYLFQPWRHQINPWRVKCKSSQ